VPFEDLGSIDLWLKGHGAEVRYTRFFAGDTLRPLKAVDLLIVLGGPMSVNDEAEHPWLRAEKQAIRDAIARDIPVLGLCLGAQLIAAALGSRVSRNAVKEMGWFPVRGMTTPPPVFRFPSECTVFHWHGETFDLPPDAVRLAESDGCKNQAFQLKYNVIGLQFHLETTPEGVNALLDNCRGELEPGRYVQSEREFHTVPISLYQAINGLMSDVLEYLVGPLANKPVQPVHDARSRRLNGAAGGGAAGQPALGRGFA
jgi:GMP synthase-like glutamine amidotransferase